MRMTRRQFASAVGSTIALTVLGCSDESEPSAESGGRKRRELTLPDKPFSVGAPDRYQNPGVYQNYRESHGIWLVSDGKQLVALSAVCTHNGCGTRYDSMARIFKCPCHSSTFTTDGLNQSGGKAKRPLERCKITLPKDAGELLIDPTQRYRQDVESPISGRGWSSPNSIHVFKS